MELKVWKSTIIEQGEGEPPLTEIEQGMARGTEQKGKQIAGLFNEEVVSVMSKQSNWHRQSSLLRVW